MMPSLVSLLLLAVFQDSPGPRFASGKPPVLPPLAANGGLVGLELRIAPSGIVQEAIVVDDSPPFTEELKKVVRLWSFEPRVNEGARVEGRVAVIALFRGQTLMGGGPPPPQRVSNPSAEIPYPASTATPAYPPRALSAGVVMLEVEVDPNGEVAAVESLDSAEGFGAVAAEAVRQFRFLPAKRDGKPISSHAILIFGFPQPITLPRPR